MLRDLGEPPNISLQPWWIVAVARWLLRGRFAALSQTVAISVGDIRLSIGDSYIAAAVRYVSTLRYRSIDLHLL